MTPTERDTILESVHTLLGEMRDILHHESGEPGDWAYDDATDDELTHAARYMSARVINQAEKVSRAVRRAETTTRLHRSRANRTPDGEGLEVDRP